MCFSFSTEVRVFPFKICITIYLNGIKMEAMARDLTISTPVDMQSNATSSSHDFQPLLVPRHNIYDMYESLVGN